MNSKSIAQLKKMFAANQIDQKMINELKKDQRKGVQQIVNMYDKKREKDKQAEQLFNKMTHFESYYYKKGYSYIAGVDEAGRGPLAGPVVAASVILPKGFKLIGLTDSKKLSAKDRMTFFNIIKKQAINYSISVVSNEIIDQVNILEATKKAMKNAIYKLQPKPDQVLIDAVHLEQIPYPSESIVKGDQKSISIAAASVLAKVTRDRIMVDIHKEYPMYQFSSNMGYGTKEHMKMIEKYGISPYHRTSFAPIKEQKLKSVGGT